MAIVCNPAAASRAATTRPAATRAAPEATPTDAPGCGAAPRALFRSGVVTIHDSACAARVAGCADRGDAHRLVFTRAGAFVAARGLRGPVVVGDPTRVLLANAGESLPVRHAAAGGHACTTFAFCAEAIPRPFARRDVTVPPSVLYRYHALHAAVARGPVDPRAVEEQAIALLREVLAAGAGARPGDDSRRRRRALVEAARESLVRAPGRAHHLSDVAGALDISASHLAHVFRAEMGMPLHQYLLHLRLAVALERLADGDAHLSALALDLGFATHSHFSAAFRKWYGASPAAVRRALTARGASGVRASGRRPPVAIRRGA